jgi:hypothetical protein
MAKWVTLWRRYLQSGTGSKNSGFLHVVERKSWTTCLLPLPLSQGIEGYNWVGARMDRSLWWKTIPSRGSKSAEAQRIWSVAHCSIHEQGCIACSVSAFLKSIGQNRLETLLQEGFGERNWCSGARMTCSWLEFFTHVVWSLLGFTSQQKTI